MTLVKMLGPWTHREEYPATRNEGRGPRSGLNQRTFSSNWLIEMNMKLGLGEWVGGCEGGA